MPDTFLSVTILLAQHRLERVAELAAQSKTSRIMRTVWIPAPLLGLWVIIHAQILAGDCNA